MTHYDYEYYSQLIGKHTEKNGDCINWTGAVQDGYGVAIYFGCAKPHQAMWMMSNCDDIPDGMVIRHKCKQNPLCVNEDHLEIGTIQNNADDRIRDNTQLRGEEIYTNKLTETQAKELINSFGDNESAKSKALRYGVSVSTIYAINKAEIWRHLMTEEQIKTRETYSKKETKVKNIL